MLLSCLQSWESHEQSASAAALEQSSFGILSAETLAEASAFAAPGAGGASFAGFHNITASLKAPSGGNNDSAVFKMPAVRRSKKEAASASTSLRKMAMDKNMKDSQHPSGEAASRRLQGLILCFHLIH